MTEKEQFLNTMQREFPTTLKVLKAFPAGKAELKPHAMCKSARELAWNFVMEEKACDMALEKGALEFRQLGAAPATLPEVISTYETAHAKFVDRLKQTADSDLNKPVKFMTGPKQMGDIRKMDLLWFMLMDSIHHRGQMTVYLRMADGKVPSIYGPSADEPWQ